MSFKIIIFIMHWEDMEFERIFLPIVHQTPHPNPPPSRGREYLYKSPPLAGGARGGGL